MALTKDRAPRTIRNPQLMQAEWFRVAAGATIYHGGLVFRDPDGNAVATSDSGDNPFIGVASVGFDNGDNSETTWDKPLRVEWGHVEKLELAGVLDEDVLKLVYASDDDTLSLSATDRSIVGRIVSVLGGNQALVHIQQLGSLS